MDTVEVLGLEPVPSFIIHEDCLVISHEPVFFGDGPLECFSEQSFEGSRRGSCLLPPGTFPKPPASMKVKGLLSQLGRL